MPWTSVAPPAARDGDNTALRNYGTQSLALRPTQRMRRKGCCWGARSKGWRLCHHEPVYSFEFWEDCTGLHGDIRAIAK